MLLDDQTLFLLFICALLILPRWLQRFRIPAPLTCFAAGMLLAVSVPSVDKAPINFAAVLGIASLFLFAGLEVDLRELFRFRAPVLRFLALRCIGIGTLTLAAIHGLGMGWQAALLLALALLTSSTGFIIDSLDRFGLNAAERFWITNKAISGELLALAFMFVALQSDSSMHFATASFSIIGIVVLIPLAYLAFSRWLLPHAPGAEFSLLILMAIVAAFVTNRLGVEFLLGAFIAGLMARQLRSRLPSFSSESNVAAVKLFSTFFVPFYFFRNGTQVPLEAFDMSALGIGAALCLLIPIRIGMRYLQARHQGLSVHESRQIAVALTPTLVFTLVIAHILHERFQLPND